MPERREAQLLRIRHEVARRCTDPDFGLSSCAATLGLSEGHIRNLLAATGESFGALLMRAKLSQAERMLSDPTRAHLPVSTIAFAAGFRDAAHFGRRFRKAYGMPPAEWRRRGPH